MYVCLFMCLGTDIDLNRMKNVKIETSSNFSLELHPKTYLLISKSSKEAHHKSETIESLIETSKLHSNQLETIDCDADVSICEVEFKGFTAPCLVHRNGCQEYIFNETSPSEYSIDKFLFSTIQTSLVDASSLEDFMETSERSGISNYVILLGKMCKKGLYNHLFHEYKTNLKIGFVKSETSTILGVRGGLIVKCKNCEFENNVQSVILRNMEDEKRNSNDEHLNRNENVEEPELLVSNSLESSASASFFCDVELDLETKKFITLAEHDFVTTYSSAVWQQMEQYDMQISILYSLNELDNTEELSWYQKLAQHHFSDQSSIGTKMLFTQAKKDNTWIIKACEEHFHTTSDMVVFVIKKNKFTCIDFHLETIEDFLEESVEEHSFLRFTTYNNTS